MRQKGEWTRRSVGVICHYGRAKTSALLFGTPFGWTPIPMFVCYPIEPYTHVVIIGGQPMAQNHLVQEDKEKGGPTKPARAFPLPQGGRTCRQGPQGPGFQYRPQPNHY